MLRSSCRGVYCTLLDVIYDAHYEGICTDYVEYLLHMLHSIDSPAAPPCSYESNASLFALPSDCGTVQPMLPDMNPFGCIKIN